MPLIPTLSDRLSLIAAPARAGQDFASAVAQGLAASPKSIPSVFFYDQAGSDLFAKITRLPEYYLTRCESEILRDNAPEIIAVAGGRVALVEFGSGSGEKTRLLIEALIRANGEALYSPIDISREYLASSVQTLLADYPALRVQAVAGEYRDGLASLPPADRPRLALFMGSNIGNMPRAEAVEFLRLVRDGLRPGDRLLLGADLVKDPAIIEAAYSDSAGVTAAFNKNILRRVNEQLGGQFDVDAFHHHAPFVGSESRIEMRLVSARDQDICVESLGRSFRFKKGEWILTEISQKYTPEGMDLIAAEAGFDLARAWTDRREWFRVALYQPAGSRESSRP